jgi:outer membrane protein OmpU
MKNVLLATTAIALTAGYAAADVSYGASAKLAYGNFGTGTAATAAYAYSQEFDFTITGSGEAAGVAYSAGMTLDEGGADGQAAITMSSNGFTYAYDANDFGGLVSSGADGEDDDNGDWMLSYAGNGISASYEVDVDSPGRYELILGYAANGMSVGLQASDDDGDNTADLADADAANDADASAINTVSVGYTIGALALSYKADDQATQNYDVSATYTIGATALTAATDENEQHSIKIATTVGGVGITARTEQDVKGTNAGAESEFGLSYTMGALSVAYARDTGQNGKFGDEAETVTTITYDMGGITLVGKATDQDETEVSAAFTF